MSYKFDASADRYTAPQSQNAARRTFTPTLKRNPNSAAARMESGAPLLQRKGENAPEPNALDAYLEQLRKNKLAREEAQIRQDSEAALKHVGGIGNVIGDDADPEAVAQLNAEVNANPLLRAQQDPAIQERYDAMMAQKAQEAQREPPSKQERPEKYNPAWHSFTEPNKGRFYEDKAKAKRAEPTSPASVASDAFESFRRPVQQLPYYDAQMRPIAPVYSDETKKSGKTVNELDELLAALKESAATYKYNDPSMNPSDGKGEGQRYAGVMAQRLEAVPNLGKGLVSDTPNGKVVEGKASLSAALAAIGRQQQQIEELKKGRK